jgi:PIN domain nuclease of toxin-antitoxin system
MSKVVLDASAILAVLNDEPGAGQLTDDLLAEAVASTVNLAEVQKKLVECGVDPEGAWKRILVVVSAAVPFTAEQARIAGDLVLQTEPAGLSLGDRACLALGTVMKAPVYTTDRVWKKLNLGIAVHIVR